MTWLSSLSYPIQFYISTKYRFRIYSYKEYLVLNKILVCCCPTFAIKVLQGMGYIIIPYTYIWYLVPNAKFFFFQGSIWLNSLIKQHIFIKHLCINCFYNQRGHWGELHINMNKLFL